MSDFREVVLSGRGPNTLSVAMLERFADLLRKSFSTPGPFLIELPLE